MLAAKGGGVRAARGRAKACPNGGTGAGDEATALALRLEEFPPELVRNFSIIAHIDHGKSTLADRLLEVTGTIRASAGNKQVLDRLQVEQERGITVKAQTVSVLHSVEGRPHLLNLIDTPGHVDFGYEVSTSLAASQGTLLVVDATQGVQAQTLANFYLAFERDVAIIPVINKVDLPTAQPERVAREMVSAFDVAEEDILHVSAKTGAGVPAILDAVVQRVPPPVPAPAAVGLQVRRPGDGAWRLALTRSPQALLFDSWYDPFRGVINLVRVVGGTVGRGDRVQFMATGTGPPAHAARGGWRD